MAAFVPDLNFTICKQFIATTDWVLADRRKCCCSRIHRIPCATYDAIWSHSNRDFRVLMLWLVTGSGVFASGSPTMVQMKRFRRYFLALITLTGSILSSSSLFVSVCMSSSGPFYLSFLFISTD
ncbi:hypothetical protein GQ600_3434 [Phytophthora cactorum]|nr:hypothetical protein GQ600_3434 [Phytophthora cactorum]